MDNGATARTTETTMARYMIENTTSGVELGVYEGNSEAEAWAALCAEIGADEQPGSDIRFVKVED